MDVISSRALSACGAAAPISAPVASVSSSVSVAPKPATMTPSTPPRSRRPFSARSARPPSSRSTRRRTTQTASLGARTAMHQRPPSPTLASRPPRARARKPTPSSAEAPSRSTPPLKTRRAAPPTFRPPSRTSDSLAPSTTSSAGARLFASPATSRPRRPWSTRKRSRVSDPSEAPREDSPRGGDASIGGVFAVVGEPISAPTSG